ncbi:CBS domain-containing protein [Peribacillus deserti]|uniref:CBS domain-containing protein n=1 Tax=Peribacillus deserti TaxID=673318 RepID=A0ABS2QNH9_9BACI|nr:CBS domain-containing protein [Peribacillus deserti]MBM7694726.1 CBS domain-containing protein [Peribacillus deserti]
MFVKSIMIPKHNCCTIQTGEPIAAALKKLEENKIDALPVLEGEKYAGIITRHDLYEYFFLSNQSKETFLAEVPVIEIAKQYKDRFIKGDEIFERTLLALKDFPIMPLVGGKSEFLGIVTRFDVLEQFQSAFGMNRPGVRIAFTSVETEGRIAKVTDIAHQFHEHIISLVTFDDSDKLVRRIVMKIEKNHNIQKFMDKLESSGFRILNVTED